MLENSNRYNHVDSRKLEGAHYTPENFANFISTNITSLFFEKNPKLNQPLKIIDPAVGDGELLLSLINKLSENSIKNIEVYGFDTNEKSVEITMDRIADIYPDLIINLKNEDFLEYCLDLNNEEKFDMLIANPPYIRTQVLGADQSQKLSQDFGLKGRLDIYQAFIVAMKSILHPTSVAGLIVSNRFMTTKGCKSFREYIFGNYNIENIWDFGDTKVFEAAVLPVVLTLTPACKKNNIEVPFSSVYISSEKSTPMIYAKDQIEALSFAGEVRSDKDHYIVKHGYLSFSVSPSDVWRLQNLDSKSWLDNVQNNTWLEFKDIGKIRVGVKTTADNVFIRKDWSKEVGFEPELLKPLTTHHVAGRFNCNKNVDKKKILYTHTSVGGKRVVDDINNYPNSKKYLESHREQLEGRNYVIKAKRNWFEIWVPQQPNLWEKPKVIFRDITEKPMFWLDVEGTIVNGDCYWMIKERDDIDDDILWLILAVANSKFIECFYDIKFQNKLYSNRRRFITQYVEQFPIPDPSNQLSRELIELSKSAFQENSDRKKEELENLIDAKVWAVFNTTKL